MMKTIQGEHKLTLRNFDKWIGAAILQRGQQYYENGAVLNIEENTNDWTAEVEGSDIYTVTVSLKSDQEIKDYFCDCPYDGDICKHLAAVFLAMREEIDQRGYTLKRTVKKDPFEVLLTKINAHEYNKFTMFYAAKNKEFKMAFELFFADKDDKMDIGEKYNGLIRNLVKKFSSRGFVDYRSSSLLAKEINKLISSSYELAHKKNYKDALIISISVLKEMLQVITACDDSNGSLGGTVFNAIRLINEIAQASEAPADIKEHIFSVLQTELINRLYFDYGDFGYELFSIFEELAIRFSKHTEFLNFIDTILPILTGKYDGYRRDFFETQRINFLISLGREDDAEKLIQQHLDIEAVRQGEVNKMIDRKDFITAKNLVEDGIKIAAARQHPGIVFRWENELLRIAVLEKDLPVVRLYCKKFAFSRQLDKQYYNQWKKTYNKEDWPQIIEDVINEIVQRVKREHENSRWTTLNTQLLYALAPLYIEENIGTDFLLWLKMKIN